jgi:hypothetical protein
MEKTVAREERKDTRHMSERPNSTHGKGTKVTQGVYMYDIDLHNEP